MTLYLLFYYTVVKGVESDTT